MKTTKEVINEHPEVVDWNEKNKQWTPQQGEMVEVSNRGKIWRQREFLAMTSDGKYFCWYTDKTHAAPWNYCRPIEKKPLTFGEWWRDNVNEHCLVDELNDIIKSYAKTEDGKKWLNEIMKEE